MKLYSNYCHISIQWINMKLNSILRNVFILWYFYLVYGLNVDKVDTLNYIGAIRRSPKGGRRFRERDFKKVYLTLNEDIEPFF